MVEWILGCDDFKTPCCYQFSQFKKFGKGSDEAP